VKERGAFILSGWVMLALELVGLVAATRTFVVGIGEGSAPLISASVAGFLLLGIVASGFVLNPPNVARVVTLLGSYIGTVRRTGLSWTVPLTWQQRISLRVRNFDSQVLKVNDAVGNPVEVAAVVVWRVVDTARAAFAVEDYEEFVQIQTETAVRHMASLYPYDTYAEGQLSLRANAEEVTATLHAELQEHLEQAGVEVVWTQLRRLAYAPEIAADMLRRQQAEAVVAARTRIVEGAVGMVQEALELLSAQDIVQLDEERKAAMVSNLLVVLCSEHHTQPIVNTGSLYQ
jgi:regulator of protease activity HflC (stomatin/prohibitin superfamily)